MNIRFGSLLLVLSLVLSDPANADDERVERVQFKQGESETVVAGKITGNESVLYKVNARDGQFLKVSLRPDNQSAEYNIYIPGLEPGDDALFGSATGGREYFGQLYKSGDHSISVFLNRNAARKGETARYDLAITVTSRSPEEVTTEGTTEVSSSGEPGEGDWKTRAAGASLAAVRELMGHDRVSLISVERGETATIVMVRVEGAEAPWRCRHYAAFRIMPTWRCVSSESGLIDTA